jgi:hypothetical protein
VLLECHFRADQEARKIVFRDVHQFAATQTAVASRYVVETFGISERILTPRQQSQPITDSTEREMPAEFEPTTDQRALVQNAAAFGINQADIANQLNIDEKTLRKHFREELNSGKFKVDMLAGRTVTELMKSGEERVRLDAAKYYTARRMGWKESNVSEHVGKDGGPIENKDVTARELFESRMAGIVARRAEASVPGGDDAESA